jgi:CheY-like chemotaxis protein/anti-sigma regulatory factor (Ser/Thr protein kinase)
MLDSLMDISKIDGGTISIQPRCISLLSLIKDEVGLYRPLAQEKKLSLILKSAHDFEIVADPIMIRRVVSNLLDNALKYTQAGSITVSVSKADGYFNIEIVDTGVGISDHDQSLIFKEFFQVNNPERDRRKGVGLGLSIVQRLIDQLDGKITVNSDLGRGTSILVTLPELVNLTITNEHLDSKLVAFENLADHHILIIDDDIEVRESLELLLEGWGIITICAESIDEAMRKLKKSNTYIDSMIVDYRLRNNETGIEAIKKVRELLNDAQLPALIITGDTAADQLITLKQSGYTYLNKPINAQVLNTHLANMLANKIIAMDLA